MAAATRSGVELSDDWKAWAVPWKEPSRVGGTLREVSSAWILSTAWPRETPGARLKERVTAGNWPSWLTESGSTLGVKWASALSSTWAPVGPRMKRLSSAD